jgi:hypothetical protein
MRELELGGKNHSTVRACPKVENRKVPRGRTGSANGYGCLGTVKDRPAESAYENIIAGDPSDWTRDYRVG